MLHLKEASIRWSIKSIIKNHDTYIFPFPFEYTAINENLDEVIDYIKKIDVLKNGLRWYRTAITPKSAIGFRITTQLDPIDTIITNAIIYEKYQQIEQNRIKKEDNRVFSFRLKPDETGNIYDEKYNWSTFLKAAEDKLNNQLYDYVLVTDISDFFPSIYLHNTETVLFDIEGRNSHFQTLVNHLKAMHLNQTHKGLPVGPQFSRPIAELILNTIDTQLLENDIDYIRYVDDFFIFCNSEGEAYKNLAFLAQILYSSRNLKLNEQKTAILTRQEFKEKHLMQHEDLKDKNIIDNFQNLLSELNIDTDPYKNIDLDDLNPEDREKIEKANLGEIFKKEISEKTPNLGLINFVLANLAKVDNTDIAEVILKEENLRKILSLLRSVINYLHRVRSFSEEQKKQIGTQVINIAEGYIGNLEFNRMWLLHLFTTSCEWDNEVQFKRLFNKFSDSLTQRELYLALGYSNNIDYFRVNKSKNLDQDSWLRRAFIAGISCLPEDERKPWFNSRALTNRDFLDQIVEKWILKNPIV